MEFFTRVIVAIGSGSGFAALDWKTALMLVIACVLLYMGIGKGFEPLLLVPIAFGMLLANLPITGLSTSRCMTPPRTAVLLALCGCSIRAFSTPSTRRSSLWESAR